MKRRIRNALGICVILGILNCLMTEKTIEEFVNGFMIPFKWILIYSIFGQPLYFLGKKYPKAAKIIRRVGLGCFAFMLIALVLLAIIAS